MKCQKCGGTISELTKFCPNCGREARKSCPTCTADIDTAAKFCSQCGTPQPREPVDRDAREDVEIVDPATARAEYRQVTVMFCDMVDSTSLSERLDVEDLRHVFQTFRMACIETIEGLGGHIDKYSGDGVMSVFGYPIAYEDAPRRGALAGLELLRQIEALNEGYREAFGITIKLRIGIHTGRVVAGELGAGASREAFAIVGLTPNIAARLEGLAPHDSVVVSADLQKLIAPYFAFERLGLRNLKGIKRPIDVFRLLGPLPAGHTDGGAPTFDFPLAGRDQEVGTLLEAWQRVDAERQASLAFVVGEPGIGKTGLASLFLQSADIDDAQLMMMSCSAYDQDTPFGPVVRMLARELGLSVDGASGASRGLASENIIAETPEADRETLETLFRLLWRDPRQGVKPVLEGLAERRELLRALVQYLKDKGRPLLLLLEDAHWADPSTIELVDRILRQPDDLPVLILALSRPDAVYPWDDDAATRLHLRGLPAASCELIVRRLTGGKLLERRLLDKLVSVTGGVPLFVEELTKSLLGGGKLIERQGLLTIVHSASDLDTPVTILDLLTARLDALGPVKVLAQIAAVVGRNFVLDALISMSDKERPLIRRGLDRLIRADFVVDRSDEDGERFEFRHALYQKAAYDSLLRGDRQQLHARHLKWLESDDDRKATTPPELLAFYSEQAGFMENALRHWIEAGEAANRASASQEAVQHFKSGLRTLKGLPKTEENALTTLRLLTLLGGSLMMSLGPGAAETRDVYEQAVAHCRSAPESPWHFPAYWGWWRVSENFTVMLQRAEQLVAISDNMKESEFSLQAHHCNWVNAFMVGDHGTCIRHADRGLEIYDQGKFVELGSLYGGHDPKVCGLGETALSKWLIGEADQALDLVERCLAWADKIDHQGSRLHALDIAVMLHHYRRDVGAVRLLAHEMKVQGEQYELDDYRAKSMLFEGWQLADGGALSLGLKHLEDGFAIMREQGAREDFPVYYAMLAACRLKMGDGICALHLLEEALNVIEAEGVTYWAPEIYRYCAEVLMAMSPDEEERIDGYLQNAISIARGQKALALELRVMCTKARRLKIVGRADEALNGIREVTGRFKEGWETRDLKEAVAQMKELEAIGVLPSYAG